MIHSSTDQINTHRLVIEAYDFLDFSDFFRYPPIFLGLFLQWGAVVLHWNCVITTPPQLMPESKKKILCVEDHEDSCRMVADLLKDYEVVGVYSKADALTKAMSGSFDLYLLDYHLPDGTGLELCLLIRTFDPDTPIFFCTSTYSITKKEIETAGAQGLIMKGPKFVNELRSVVSRTLPLN
jgi:CheY-like chemotaxis protein